MKFLTIQIFKGTILSTLVFFSVSFLPFLYKISPLTRGEDSYKLDIGFPFKYYSQFQLRGNDFLNSGWNVNNLVLDCVIYWIVICGLYILIKRMKKADNKMYET